MKIKINGVCHSHEVPVGDNLDEVGDILEDGSSLVGSLAFWSESLM